jgi:5-oxoprolinase (ATP-hydrolysing) subunit A
MYSVDLNCDLGESYGAYTIGMDSEVIPFVSSVNIACGFHASDPVVMEKTVALAADNGAAVGAHPGFPDLMGFGRRQMKITPAEAKAYCIYQIGALAAFAHEYGIAMQHVKPHGALYNMAANDYELAKGICEGITAVDKNLILLALSGSMMLKAAADCGLRSACEVFADRAYEEDGSLVARNRSDAMITDEDEAVRRVIRMVKDHLVTAVTGKDVQVKADSICVHGDSPKALVFVRKIRTELEKAGIAVKPFGA